MQFKNDIKVSIIDNNLHITYEGTNLQGKQLSYGKQLWFKQDSPIGVIEEFIEHSICEIFSYRQHGSVSKYKKLEE